MKKYLLVFYVINSILCWIAMFIAIIIQADMIVISGICWISGCFAGLFISKVTKENENADSN